MRLIDADRVKKDLLAELLSGVDGGTDASWLKTYEVIDRIENIVNEWVDNQITVEAIPIEEKKMSKAILIIDMPEHCFECPLYDDELCRYKKALCEQRKYCPLKPYKEVIPIEWIEKWLDTWTPDLPVAEMMKDWEKENESNN